MKYSRFERIVIVIIMIAVLSISVAIMIQLQADRVDEIVGHMLILPIIAASLHWGKKGALISALGSFAIYFSLRVWDVGAWSFSDPIVQLMIAKVFTYSLLSVMCAYMHSQFRYLFVKMENHDYIDDETQIGNGKFLLKELTSRINENERYQIPFSVILCSLNPTLVSGLKQRRNVNVIKDVSNSILKNDTRTVDELARVNNEFVVILPSTKKDGAEICSGRLNFKMKKYMDHLLDNGDSEKSFDMEIYTYPDDSEEIERLLMGLRSELEEATKNKSKTLLGSTDKSL